MKYLALVAACLLTMALAAPATADDPADPAPLGIELAGDIALGASSTVPVAAYAPELADGDVVQLDWILTADPSGDLITSGSGSYVVGEQPPLLAVPDTTTATDGLLSVHAVVDSAGAGPLEGDASQVYPLDFSAPSSRLQLSDDVLFPARDQYFDWVRVRVGTTDRHIVDGQVDLVAPDGSARRIAHATTGHVDFRYTGRYQHSPLRTGLYTVRATMTDWAGNTTVEEEPLTIDDRHLDRLSYTRTIPAVQTLADEYVGACSHLGAAKGRGWKGSLGLYSTTPCARKNGSVVITVHGAWLPPSVRGYENNVRVTMYGGAAKGSGRAYLVHGWLRASDNAFVGRQQFTGKVGPHSATIRPRNMVREIDGNNWVYWQLGLSEGSHYDVKSFTVHCTYWGLVAPSSRTASDAKTIAEPSGAPGPGYTVPKTDAAELPAAYSPGT